jgi:uncharacterized phiE125 gp8 family phage protein
MRSLDGCDISDVRQVVAPTAEPLSIEVVKQHLRLGGDPEEYDDFEAQVLPLYVAAARRHAENVTGLYLTDAVYELRLSGFPQTISFPGSPVAAVESIAYTDTDGSIQTLSTSVYVLDDHPYRPQLVLGYLEEWPAVRSAPGAVVIRYRGPYGSPDDSPARQLVPEGIRAAMLLLIGHWYENREVVKIGNITSTLDFSVSVLLGPYRRFAGI